MPPDDPAALTRQARRWADAAWVEGRHATAIDILDRAILLHPTCYRLHRKRGAFLLVCPDPTVRDEEQAFADLWRACALAGWREDIAGWVIGLLAGNGDTPQANAIARALAARGRRPGGDEGA